MEYGKCEMSRKRDQPSAEKMENEKCPANGISLSQRLINLVE